MIKLFNKWLSPRSSIVSNFFKPQSIQQEKKILIFPSISFFLTFNTIKIHFILCEIFIYSFLSLWSISTLFTGINSSWLKSESIREIENKTSMVFNLVSARNTILSCFFFFFINYWLMLLVSLWKFLVFASNSISLCFFFFSWILT